MMILLETAFVHVLRIDRGMFSAAGIDGAGLGKRGLEDENGPVMQDPLPIPPVIRESRGGQGGGWAGWKIIFLFHNGGGKPL